MLSPTDNADHFGNVLPNSRMLSQIDIVNVLVMLAIINCSLFQLYNNRILLCLVLTWNAIYFCWKRIDGLWYWPVLLDFIATIKFCTQLCNQSDFNNKFGPCMLSLRLVRWSDRSLIWKVQKHLLHTASMGGNTRELCRDLILSKNAHMQASFCCSGKAVLEFAHFSFNI